MIFLMETCWVSLTLREMAGEGGGRTDQVHGGERVVGRDLINKRWKYRFVYIKVDFQNNFGGIGRCC